MIQCDLFDRSNIIAFDGMVLVVVFYFWYMPIYFIYAFGVIAFSFSCKACDWFLAFFFFLVSCYFPITVIIILV